MQAVPRNLTDAFAEVDRRIVEAWWTTLADEARDEIARLCDERLEACFFGIVTDDDGSVPKVRGGRFVPPDEDSAHFDEWAPGYFEHLLAHPELVVIYDLNEGKFHLGCTRHPAAQACWLDAHVPVNFTCPFEKTGCLMRPLVGRAIRRARACRYSNAAITKPIG